MKKFKTSTWFGITAVAFFGAFISWIYVNDWNKGLVPAIAFTCILAYSAYKVVSAGSPNTPPEDKDVK